MWYIYVAVVTSSTRISLLLNSILEFHLSYLLFVDQRHCLKFLSNPVCLAIVPAFCK
ncbi:hypothetical protein LINGRAHAP2_LOCUS14245, partial [Linum grandiflorum]